MNDIFIVPLKDSSRVAIIDPSDAPRVMQFDWSIHSMGYATTWFDNTNILMHRFIMCVNNSSIIVDHKNRLKKDNRRSNLRIVSDSLSIHNRAKWQRHPYSNYVGVSWDKSRFKWSAKITNHYKTINLGRFNSEHEAAIAYNKAAFEIYGHNANLNEVKF
jgi:AP2-like factor (euAP2 lineage)